MWTWTFVRIVSTFAEWMHYCVHTLNKQQQIQNQYETTFKVRRKIFAGDFMHFRFLLSIDVFKALLSDTSARSRTHAHTLNCTFIHAVARTFSIYFEICCIHSCKCSLSLSFPSFRILSRWVLVSACERAHSRVRSFANFHFRIMLFDSLSNL